MFATALSNMPQMEPGQRSQLITEYLRKQQGMFNEPRHAFGMGINQVTIDILGDDIAKRLDIIDTIKEREIFLREQAEALGAGSIIGQPVNRLGDTTGGGFRGGPVRGSDRAVGAIPDNRQAIGPTTIITTGQTAADIALAPLQARAEIGAGGGDRASAIRAARIAQQNPGLLDEEVAMLASSGITGVSNFLNELNSDEVLLVTEQLRQAASLATDPGEKNMFNLLLDKIDKFSQQSRQPVE